MIHDEAIRRLGAEERLQHLRKEAIELAHAIDRFCDGKTDATEVVSEAHDVEFIARALPLLYPDLYTQDKIVLRDFRSTVKLKKAMGAI